MALFFSAGLFSQNQGVTPGTVPDRSRLNPAKQLRKSISPFKFLLTDATNEVKYWNKDSVFVFFKVNVDSIINNYNDTVQVTGLTPCRDSMYRIGDTLYHKNAYCAIQKAKITPACIDSMWKVGNTVYHKNTNCAIQSFLLVQGCTDSLWKITDTIYHRNTSCEIQKFKTTDGCAGGRVFAITSLGDTTGLTPPPVCGDVLVLTSDTCQDYLYVRGAAPPRWNYVGTYIKNKNCANFCYNITIAGTGESIIKYYDCDSLVLWKIRGQGGVTVTKDGQGILIDGATAGNYTFTNVGGKARVLKDTALRQIVYRTIEGLGSIKVVENTNTISIQDTASASNGRLHKKVGAGHWINRLSDTDVDANREFKTIIAGDHIIIDTTSTTVTLTSTSDTILHKNTGVGVGKIVKADNVSSDDNRKFKSIIKGDGIDVVNLTDEVQITAVVDTVDHRNIGTGYNVVAEGTIATNSDYNRKFRSIKSDGTISMTYAGVLESGYFPEISLRVDTTKYYVLAGNYDMVNVGSGSQVYRNTTGFNPKTFNLRTIKAADASISVIQANDTISLKVLAAPEAQKITAINVASNNAAVQLTPQPAGDRVNIVGSGIVTVNTTSAGVNGIITVNATENDGDPNNEIQTYAHSGTGGYTNTLSQGGGTFSIIAGTNISIARSGGDVTINSAIPTSARDSFWTHSVSSTAIVSKHSNVHGVQTSQTITAGDRMALSSGSIGANGGSTIGFSGIAINATPSLAVEQDILSGNGTTAIPLTVSNCGVDYPNASVLARYVMIQPNGAYNCLVKCPTAIDCTAQLNSINDGSKLASVQDQNDMNGLFTAMIDVINRQNARIAQLETPQTFASAGTVNVSARLYDQQATIANQNVTLLSQAKLIEDLTARLDRLDMLTASK